jgi:DNA helicase-2/ATP-dependent DNA helicase PcrA
MSQTPGVIKYPKYSAQQIGDALRIEDPNFKGPSPEQIPIIESTHFGPTVIIAGAGSGKTETMSARVLWLVANGFVKPEEILGLTFTRKAAGELSSRIRRRLRQLRKAGLLPLDPQTGSSVEIAVTVATYHSYAGRVLSDHAIRMGIDVSAEPIGEAAAWQIANNIVNNFESITGYEIQHSAKTVVDKVMDLSAALGEHGKSVGELHDFLVTELAKYQAVDDTKSNDTFRDAKATLNERLAILPMVEAYDRHRLERGLLTFNDQMSLAAKLVTQELGIEVAASERNKYKVVLLDEYQDTSVSQVKFLAALFGQGHFVTAVGDPNQAIYGWRSASAQTLSTFGRTFTGSSDVPCLEHNLLTTWRNDENILEMANEVVDHIGELIAAIPSRPGSSRTDKVERLKLRPGANKGELVCGQYESLTQEAEAIADYFAKSWFDPSRTKDPLKPKTFAVLVRNRRYIPEIEQALRSRNIPVEVVGLGGLIHIPEVADILALLRTLIFPDLGSSLMRLITGPHLALGPQDLTALGKFSRSLVKNQSESLSKTVENLMSAPSDETLEAEDFAIGSAIEALDVFEKAPREYFSPAGYERLVNFAKDLKVLRRHLTGGITDAILEAERFLHLDTEVLVRDGWQSGRKYLDQFLDEAAKFARNGGTLSSFLDWLKIADSEEGGLKPTSIEVNKEAVQILTVHAAKGSEWDFVAVPGLVERNFPSSGKSLDIWTKNVGALPLALRGDGDQFTDFKFPSADPKPVDVRKALEAFEDYWKAGREQEEWRLAYVAFTRAKSNLIATASWFGSGIEAVNPSALYQLVDELVSKQSAANVISKVPKPDGNNPAIENPRTGSWPSTSKRSVEIMKSADLVRSAVALDLSSASLKDATNNSFISDALALIAEANRGSDGVDIYLPTRISVSTLINLAKDPDELALNIRRPIPNHIDRFARRGTEFHLWVEKQFSDAKIFDEDIFETVTRSPEDLALKELQESWLASSWAKKSPVAGGVEVPFETVLGGVLVRGRIDAVYKEGDKYEVVDWKTGREKSGDDLEVAAIQLATYRLAYAKLHNIALENISAAFHYVGSNQSVRPADLMTEGELISIITGK